MTLNAPSQVMFLISLVLAVLGLIGYLVPTIPVISIYPFWFALIGYIVLAAGTLMKSE